MANTTKLADIQKFLAFGDDILHVLRNHKDADALSHVLAASTSLRSHCDEAVVHGESTIQGLQKKIAACKQRIRDVEAETVSDVELGSVKKSLEEELDLENSLLHRLRGVEDELADLEKTWISMEEKEAELIRKQKDSMRSSELLSMCASTTNIIPNLDDQTRISGYIVNRNKKKYEKFDIERSSSSTEMCSNLWAMMEY